MKILLQLQIMLLILFIASGVVFADVTRKKTESSEGSYYIYYDSNNKEIAREKYSENPFDRETLSGKVPNGIVKEETNLEGFITSIEENYKDGISDGVVKNTSNFENTLIIQEYEYSNSTNVAQVKTTMTNNGSSMNETYNTVDGLINGVAKTTFLDANGNMIWAWEMTYEDNKVVGSVKYFDENGIYDPKMSKMLSEAVADVYNSDSVSSKNGTEAEDISEKNILLVVPSGKDGVAERDNIKELFESAGGKTTVVELKGAEIKLDAEGFDAVLFLGCMESSKSFWENKTVIDFIKKANSSNKVIGAIGFAPSALAKAGILKEKDATAGEGEELQKTFKDNGVNYKKKEVVVAGNIVTANGAKALKKFTNELIKLLQNKK